MRTFLNLAVVVATLTAVQGKLITFVQRPMNMSVEPTTPFNATNPPVQCELLIDDFRSGNGSRPLTGPAGADRIYDLLGGDYGGVGLAGTPPIIINNGTGKIVPLPVPVQYFFAKFDPFACFNSTAYTHVSMDFIFPNNSDFQIAFTQKAPNCVDRLLDSSYHNLTSFITPNGTQQHVNIPFSAFNTNVNGTAYDWTHIKDLTFLNFYPANVTYTFTRMSLINLNDPVCAKNLTGLSTNGTNTTTTNTTNTANSTTAAAKSGAGHLIANAGGMGVFMLAMFNLIA
ncbi:hypothetical protein SmJEL517_g04836 [Synchytrium microbalum]|uniref:Secreted protein n=1 Tax=Synchytrium microbalum TaxID=1806994 RepID=A0A507C1H7_9FUNG|nr:uncharacterized protein SmJEL517_g04836 [Synchytrium microbalum]TPX31924.1 hypothetical protein SmJEL517_g04836 [Synchytrium microbalum]